ncbi:hypothetical protein EVAR_80004_1 [Eumeta japonica]|uniref:Uncharacterized protein n=1 Tax=Eumeta variegata TaxID=151549 RepID=A0A4C1WM39_EUMVA|nr:hypothetical protein EVAR_80004_1 [Eumeta japonica]
MFLCLRFAADVLSVGKICMHQAGRPGPPLIYAREHVDLGKSAINICARHDFVRIFTRCPLAARAMHDRMMKMTVRAKTKQSERENKTEGEEKGDELKSGIGAKFRLVLETELDLGSKF